MGEGRFIVFEGIDGAGKSTQAELLRERLAERGREVVLTAEPTSLESGRQIRRALSGEVKKTESEMATMFVLDRIAHNNGDSGIVALLQSGKDVISDRYYYSTLAYQGKTTDYEWVKAMNTRCPEIRRPDICIYLDLTPEQSLERISKRGEATEIYENLDKLVSVRNTFLSVIDDLRADGVNIVIIDAGGSAQKVAEDIFSAVGDVIFD